MKYLPFFTELTVSEQEKISGGKSSKIISKPSSTTIDPCILYAGVGANAACDKCI